jgi:hypothetical protein
LVGLGECLDFRVVDISLDAVLDVLAVKAALLACFKSFPKTNLTFEEALFLVD